LIFCNQEAITVNDILLSLKEMFDSELNRETIENSIQTLVEKYNKEEYAFYIVESGGGFQFLTKPAYQSSINSLLKQKSKRKLSTSALETLSIIAYKQPITKSYIEKIRGVNCDYSVQRLLEKNLIEIQGKSDTVGKPLLYGTTSKFMDYFGINNINELPVLKDLVTEENEIGNAK